MAHLFIRFGNCVFISLKAMKLVGKFFPDEINVNTVLEWIRNNLIKSLERFSFVVVKKSIS